MSFRPAAIPPEGDKKAAETVATSNQSFDSLSLLKEMPKGGLLPKTAEAGTGVPTIILTAGNYPDAPTYHAPVDRRAPVGNGLAPDTAPQPNKHLNEELEPTWQGLVIRGNS